jgi:hypothetical protein
LPLQGTTLVKIMAYSSLPHNMTAGAFGDSDVP